MAKWDEKKLDEFYQRLKPECKDREVYCDECGQSLGRWCGGELNSHLCARCLSPKPGDERWYWSHRGQGSTYQYYRSDGKWYGEERKRKEKP